MSKALWDSIPVMADIEVAEAASPIIENETGEDGKMTIKIVRQARTLRSSTFHLVYDEIVQPIVDANTRDGFATLGRSAEKPFILWAIKG